MNENEIRGLVDSVKDGRMDRRAFIQRMVAVGLSAPIASQILVWNGVAMAQSKLEYLSLIHI